MAEEISEGGTPTVQPPPTSPPGGTPPPPTSPPGGTESNPAPSPIPGTPEWGMDVAEKWEHADPNSPAKWEHVDPDSSSK
jgi:hypothetical protein